MPQMGMMGGMGSMNGMQMGMNMGANNNANGGDGSGNAGDNNNANNLMSNPAAFGGFNPAMGGFQGGFPMGMGKFSLSSLLLRCAIKHSLLAHNIIVLLLLQ